MKVKEHYVHNFNRPIMKKGHKLVRGDRFELFEDGTIKINGKIVGGETVLEEVEEPLIDEVEETPPEEPLEDEGTAGTIVLEDMNKDELEEYAFKQFGVDLDKRESEEALIEQIIALSKVGE